MKAILLALWIMLLAYLIAGYVQRTLATTTAVLSGGLGS